MKNLIRKFWLPKTKFKKRWNAGKKAGQTEKAFAKKTLDWKKLTPEQRLSLIQKAIKETALERRATQDILGISPSHEKKGLETKIQALSQQENSLRVLAGKYRKKIKK